MRNAKSRRGNRILASAVGAVGVMGLASVAYPATVTWDGGGADNNWTTAANWDPTSTPFPGGYHTITFAASVTGDSLNNNTVALKSYLEGINYPSGTKTLTITGNQVYISGSTITNNSTANQNINLPLNLFGTLTMSGNANSGAVTLGGVLSAGGTVTITGNANVTMSAVNLNTGEMYAKGNGKLTVASTGALSGSAAIIIYDAGTFLYNSTTATSRSVLFGTGAAGAKLGGSGAITGAITVTPGNKLAPGDSIESLKTGALTMNSGSTFEYEAANNSGTGADLLAANGALSLTNVTLNLTGANLSGGSWAVGNKLTLISYTGSDVLSGFVYGGAWVDDTERTFGANTWKLNYNDTVKGSNFVSDASGKYVTLTATVVPEPTSVAGLLASGALMALRRKKRS